MNQPQSTGPLAGVRVIEMGQLLAGPFCGQLLGDYGADIIKIEDPGTGDAMRNWGQEKAHGMSLWWPIVGRNKQSVTLNLRTEEGREVIRDLVKHADIVLENFRPGTMEKWGLGYDDLIKIKPDLIMVRVSGYGQTGPYAPLPGYGSIGEAMGGLRYIVGDPDRQPARTGISIGDSLAATMACMGAMGALFHRQQTGQGQVVDSAIYESVFAYMESLVPEWSFAGYQRERTGSTLPNVAPSNVYDARDGEKLLIAANMDSVFSRLAEAMGRPELATDERYADHGARGHHMAELDALINDWTKEWDIDELMTHLNEHAVPNGRIFQAKDMLTDPQFAAREAIVNIEHPELGPFPMQNVFPKLSATPGNIRWPGPTLGQHTDVVLTELLGYDEARLAELAAGGVTAAAE